MSAARDLLAGKIREYELRLIASDDQAVAGDVEKRLEALVWGAVLVSLREFESVLEAVEREAA